MLKVILLISLFCLGCGRSEKPHETDRTERPAPSEHATSSRSERPKVRDLDASAAREIEKAFYENPIAAKERYSNTRWRFTLMITDIGENLVIGHNGDVAAGIEMHVGESKKLINGKRAVLEATLYKYTPGGFYPYDFEDGVFAGFSTK